MSTPSKSLFTLAATGLVALLGACGGGVKDETSDVQAVSLARPSNYALKWADEFSVPGAPSSAWTYDLGSPLLGGSVWGNNERQHYTRDAANVSIADGLLRIQPVAGTPAGASAGVIATSARIKTDTPAFYSALNGTPYGYYEIRAKVPCVGGSWPAIWMMGRSGDWPARGEVDIMEWFGAFFAGQPNQVTSAIHTTRTHGSGSISGNQKLATMCNDFNLFQLHWTASTMVIGVNGVPTLTYAKPTGAGTDQWPFDQQAFLILNVAVGGNLGGTVQTADLPRMALQVDYVRVWQAP